MDCFVESGRAPGARANAAIGGEVTLDNMTIYQLTGAGLALQATVTGTKFCEDDEFR